MALPFPFAGENRRLRSSLSFNLGKIPATIEVDGKPELSSRGFKVPESTFGLSLSGESAFQRSRSLDAPATMSDVMLLKSDRSVSCRARSQIALTEPGLLSE